MGIWKSFDELEECLTIIELDLILKYKRKRENDDRRFSASLVGIDLDKDSESDINTRLEKVKRNAQIRLAGGERELEKQEFADLGFGYGTV